MVVHSYICCFYVLAAGFTLSDLMCLSPSYCANRQDCIGCTLSAWDIYISVNEEASIILCSFSSWPLTFVLERVGFERLEIIWRVMEPSFHDFTWKCSRYWSCGVCKRTANTRTGKNEEPCCTCMFVSSWQTMKNLNIFPLSIVYILPAAGRLLSIKENLRVFRIRYTFIFEAISKDPGHRPRIAWSRSLRSGRSSCLQCRFGRRFSPH